LVQPSFDAQDWGPNFPFQQAPVVPAHGPWASAGLATFLKQSVHGLPFTTTHFDQQQLADSWGLSPKTLERWRVLGAGPKYIRLPGKGIYRMCDIEGYKNECLVSSPAEFRKHTKLSGQARTLGPP